MADLVASGDRTRLMIFVYIIKSLKVEYRYIGITNNLEQRLRRHNSGGNKSTKPYAPFKLVLVEEYNNYKEARRREVFLKSGQGRKFLDEIK